jgi:predicted metal-dependent phosphoesterase TrpH
MTGSNWRKWDLHFHSQTSYDYKNGSVTDQDIIDNLVANNVAVVAITDHHTIDITRIKNLQKIGSGRITVLPGIEFLSDARGDEPIHFIGIFSEKCNIDFVWKQI